MARGKKTGGRQAGTPNKRTAAKLQQIGAEIAQAKKGGGPLRARDVLSDLTKTAVGFTAHWQQKMMAWEQDPQNTGKLVPQEYVERFLLGLNAATRAAAALAPYQDPKLAAIKVSMSPFDTPAAPDPKMIEGKALKIDTSNPVELARVYSSLVRAA